MNKIIFLICLIIIKAIIERDQFKIELVETQKRLKKLIEETDEKMTDEKQNIEAIYQQRLKENTEQVINCEIKPRKKKQTKTFH